MNKYLMQTVTLAKEFQKVKQALNVLSIRMEYENGKEMPTIHLTQNHFEKCFDKWEVEKYEDFTSYKRIVDGVKVICVPNKEVEK